jgi:hypothetical protein
MTRAKVKTMLDRAFAGGSAGIALVQGLPRVGRTSLINDWGAARGDVVRGLIENGLTSSGPVQIFDHTNVDQVAELIAAIRDPQFDERVCNLVIVPIDLITQDKFTTELSGRLERVTVEPLQPEEVMLRTCIDSRPVGLADLHILASQPLSSNKIDPHQHWLRGGFPSSLDAKNDDESLKWRKQWITDLLERDYRRWNVSTDIPIIDILRWLLPRHGRELQELECQFVKMQQLRSVLHVFQILGIIRILENFIFLENYIEKNLDRQNSDILKKIYIRDSGIFHALQGIKTRDQLHKSPRVGDSWECYAIEALIIATEGYATPYFYREKNGASGKDIEIDLVLDFGLDGGGLVAVECKTSSNAKLSPGFFEACTKIGASDYFVVHSGTERTRIGDIDRLDLMSALGRVRNIVQINNRGER